MHRIFPWFLLIAIFAIPFSALKAEGRISSIEALPASVKALYFATCAADSWIGNKRKVSGSSSKKLSDGTELFLMVCGDAASTVPFTAIVLRVSGEASEALLHWRLKGKEYRGGFGNARFGPQRDTIVSMSHSSASCNPVYTHAWDGTGFQLVAYSGAGCDRE